MTVLPLSEVKARLSEIADEVHRTHDRIRITRNGRDYVMLISVEDFESIEATLELLADPEAQRRLLEAEQELARGETTSVQEMRELLERRRREDSAG